MRTLRYLCFRWKIQWYWAGDGVIAETVGNITRATIGPVAGVHHHTAGYWARMKAAKLRSAAKRAAKRIAYAKRRAAIYAAQNGRKLQANALRRLLGMKVSQ